MGIEGLLKVCSVLFKTHVAIAQWGKGTTFLLQGLHMKVLNACFFFQDIHVSIRYTVRTLYLLTT